MSRSSSNEMGWERGFSSGKVGKSSLGSNLWCTDSSCLHTVLLKVRVRKHLASFISNVTNAMSTCENGTMLPIKGQVPPRKDDRVILHFDCMYMSCIEQIEHAAR